MQVGISRLAMLVLLIVVAKVSGTTRRWSLEMGTLRRRCGEMDLRTRRAIHAASSGGDDGSCGREGAACMRAYALIGMLKSHGGSGPRP